MTRRRIAITTGDVDGVGLEISIKALLALDQNSNATFLLFRGLGFKDQNDSQLAKRYRVTQVNSIDSALALNLSRYDIVEVHSSASPAQWVSDVAKLCLKQKVDALVTAPLSKTEIQRAGFGEIGHTEILKTVSKSKNVFMAFVGKNMNMVLATGHRAINHLTYSKDLIRCVLIESEKLRTRLPTKISRLPIGIVGPNPHAGEGGLIGQEEKLFFTPVIREFQRNGINVCGPLVADVVFSNERWRNYSILVAAYHDQGLIPFKMLHGLSQPGVHLTLGIPFVRTSVDHGTAKDIFGQNRADAGSMTLAIRLALDLTRKRRFKWDN